MSSLRSQIAEPILRVPRAFRTVGAVARHDRTYDLQAFTPDDVNWRMRSAMDLHPQMGKWLSRIGVRNSRGGTPTLDQALTSTFVQPDELDDAVSTLQRDGVYVFKHRIPEPMVTRMREHALSAPAQPRGLEVATAPYPRSAPRVGRYDIDEDQTMASPDMQDFCSDPAFARIAARYLGQPVIQDQTALWWTTIQGSADAALNAWLFHQDRDRLSFLKFFVYLTDVGPENGPHTYIKGTHRKIPRALATDGRKDDELVQRLGLWDQVVSLWGPAGTMLAVDTAGLHKGIPPEIGDRCVLQVEFATSLFGSATDYPIFKPSELSVERYAQMPQVLQRWNRSMMAAAR